MGDLSPAKNCRWLDSGGIDRRMKITNSLTKTQFLLGEGGLTRFNALSTTQQTHNKNMAKALTKSQIAAEIAEKNNITKKQAVEILEFIAETAYKNAKNSFTIPGLGKLVLVNRAARIGRNPATGEQIKIKAKRVVKFRVAKAAKDAILGVKK